MLPTSVISTLATNWTHCYSTGNFTGDSTYATNRNLLLSSLASNINSGFYNTSIGQEPDKVYGLALCRGDVSSEDCSSCVSSTSQHIMSTCQIQKEALMWDGDPAPCFVHYADRSLFGKLGIDGPINPYYIGNNLTMNLTEFDQIWQPLMENTAKEASMGFSRLKFATKEANFTSIQTIYALMQCTPDLSQSDCYSCLTRCVAEYINCCQGRQGGGVQLPNCMLRWNLYPFYNKKDIVVDSATVDELALPSSPPSVLFPPSPHLLSNSTTIKAPFVKESMQFDIGTIRAATENFSEAKKLGQGGFVKSDVISFGVLVLELVSGQKRSCYDTKEEIECLLTHAYKKWDEGTASNIIDPTLKEGSRNEMMKCIHIGLLCVQESISDRPTIASVFHMLNSNSVTFPEPAKPGFFMKSSVILDVSSSSLELNSTG
ncbi:hypothetical protein Ddye_019535 [Dipteronia dyeriana]|uniref:Gnk2-homologous domain-containing protein n=1 Tax=Dipteronia dyeriana TaxID=168575 RepID=A0AAD9WW67_9ROSI|nr:hypothetical protein Ddye_019535 [Dipteronia dyeriana]